MLIRPDNATPTAESALHDKTRPAPPPSLQVKHCATLGITADSATTLFIYLGLASILGRITSGFICDLRGVNSLYVYQMAVLVQGISTLLSVFAKTYVPLAVYSFVFGLCDGAFITTLNICLLKSVDSSRRASVIALHHPVISVFLASGAPVSGWCHLSFSLLSPCPVCSVV